MVREKSESRHGRVAQIGKAAPGMVQVVLKSGRA
ncbi:MAG: hypothetical protein JWQ71_3377 [Pedosphaera sp.]|nr:hypothetical protein [Pedosphaera sp.]